MYSFRDFEKSLCLLNDKVSINLIDPEHKSNANAILCYGYVDHAAGLTFEALSLVSCVGDDYTIVLDNNEIGLKIRADEDKMSSAKPISNKALLARYSGRIEILDLYYQNTDVVEARRIRELDPLRYPLCPDDIYVVFLWHEKEFEQMWVRCEKHLGTDDDGIRHFSGKLLNEPHRDYGFHIGKKVMFGLFVEDGRTVCIGTGNCPN